MTPERWELVKELFHAALEVTEEERAAYLAERCGTDGELREEVTGLLGQHRPAAGGPLSDDAGEGETELNPHVESLLLAHERTIDFPPSPAQPSPPDRGAGIAGAGYVRGENTPSIAGAASGPPKAPAKAHCFGDYELLEEIAHGGMGVVYKARQISLNRPVALKMILAGQFASEAEVKRFQAEAKAAANLDHHNIVGIYEIGQYEGQHYFTMQYIEGRSLAHLEGVTRWRAGTGKEAARLVAKVARAVQYAHERGILHRDLKPANILIDADGEPHISDFGLARHIGADSSLTLEGAVLGTPSFMSPEQAAGNTKELAAAADIYGLGGILYFLLTGKPPFTATSPLDTLVQVLEGEVIVPRMINPRVGRDLERICLRCLEKAPEQRYTAAGTLAEDLERFLKDEPVQARPMGLKSVFIHWMRRQPALVSRLLGLGICLATAQVTYFMYHPVGHIKIVSTLGIWGVLSFVCQWGLEQERWKTVVPFIWVMLDALCLTTVLWFDEAVPGPLVASFPVLVALSGLWFRESLVGLTTILAMLGYSVLVCDYWARNKGPEHINWHWVFLMLLVLTGCAVAYQIHRVRALSRFYERRA